MNYNFIIYEKKQGLAAGIQYEEDLWSLCFSTEDQRIGMQAFMDKKKPVFTGK